MFRKSLQVLVATALIALASVVAWATFSENGAADAIARARAMMARREFARAKIELDLAEIGQRDATQLEQVRRLRYTANKELDNAAAALRDVELLLRDGANDETLQLDRIWLLARTGDGEGALLAATRFLDENPGHSRALELAGEACQTLYQPQLTDVSTRLERTLAQDEIDEARTAMLSFVYRPEGDPEIDRSLVTLRTICDREPRIAALWPALAQDLQRVREQVQRALGFFRRSLEAGGAPVAAFRTFAWSLDQSQRIDDLLVACEVQRRCFDHVYVDEAGADATWALVRDGAYKAASATAARWLPPGTIAKRIEGQRLPRSTADLLLARTWAAWNSGDDHDWNLAMQDASVLWDAKHPSIPAMAVAGALNNVRAKDLANAERSLRWTIDVLEDYPLRKDRPDVLAGLFSTYIDVLLARNASEADVQAVFAQWRTNRPGSLEPELVLASFLLARDRAVPALAALQDAYRKRPDDEQIFARRLAAWRATVRDTERDGPALLAQCLRRPSSRPEVNDPAGYLLCGEAALATPTTLWIARDCAKAAIDAMPNARQPRLLAMRVALAERQFDDAARQGRRLLGLMPPDAETTELVLQACRAADLPLRDVLAAALQSGATGSSVDAELLRTALADRPEAAVRFASAATRAATAPTEVRILATRALAHGGDPVGAAFMLADVAGTAAEMSNANRAELTTTIAEWVAIAAPQHPDPEFAAELERLLAAAGPLVAERAGAALTTAKRIARTHPRTASALCTAALAVATPEDRNGDVYLLAGQLAARVGEWRGAEEAWTAALAFEDGRDAAIRLARLFMAQGRTERAQQLAMLIDQPTDAAMAARFGAPDVASIKFADDLERDPADLIANAGLALFDEPSTTPWPPNDDATARTERLELLSILNEPSLGSFAFERVRTMLARDPTSVTLRLLFARSLADAGLGRVAADVHAHLDAEGVDTPVFYREVAIASKARGYAASPALLAKIMGAASTGGIGDSPLTMEFAMVAMRNGFNAGGHPTMADEVWLQTWLVRPRGRPLTAEDLELIVRGHSADNAWTIIDQALTGPQPCDVRGLAIDRLHELATKVVRERGELAAPGLAAARRYLGTDGARGSIVHFLLTAGEWVPAWRVDDAERKRLLREHLQLAGSGRDNELLLPATVQLLTTIDDPAAVAESIDVLLREHPTTVALWLERARLARGTRTTAKTLGDLRTVLRRADAPALRLEATVLAAEARTLTPDDVAAFDALPPALKESPTGRYASGLVALRTGRPDDAVAPLAAAAPRADGMHLFALGLAHLQSNAADGTARAREAFETLARDYASSSLARNAGSFANQLAPR